MAWTREVFRERFAALRAKLGGRCVDCPSTEALELSHVRQTKLSGRGRGSMERYYDVIHNPDAYVLRCRPCHRAFDGGGKGEAT